MGHGSDALAVLGQRERAKDWMARALLIDPENMTMRYNFVCALANHLNDKEAALEMLGPAFEKMGAGLVNHAKIDPDMDPIREDPASKQCSLLPRSVWKQQAEDKRRLSPTLYNFRCAARGSEFRAART